MDGRWTAEVNQPIEQGAFVRAVSVFNEPIAPETIAAIGNTPKRFVLIASSSCPWSHAVLLARAIKQLTVLPVVRAGGPRNEGYALIEPAPWLPGKARATKHVHQLYTMTDPHYTGRATVPVLWDTLHERIVSNASEQIVTALDAAPGPRDFTLRPAHLRNDINTLERALHDGLANAVYRAGLAQTQEAYRDAVDAVFNTLETMNERLANQRFLFADILTQSDLRLFATLVRFDTVYATHFRCTRRRLVEFPALWGYTRDLHSLPAISATVDIASILEGYYLNDGENNPHGIVAEAPRIDWHAPHTRASLGEAKVWQAGAGISSALSVLQ